MLVALVVFSIVMAGALQFLSAQGKAVRLGNDRMGALENLQFAMSMLDAQLRTAGGGVTDQQPFLVYAGPDVMAFNADYATNVRNDIFSAYYDPDAPNGTVTAMTTAQRITIPQTSFAYPDTSFTNGPANSPAETIIFFVAPDSSTARSDDYVLYREVNAAAPETVARNILATPGAPFFQYERLFTPLDAPSYIDTVPSNQLPLAHTVPVHLASADTAGAAIIDSIRAVRVTLTVTDGNTGAAEQRRTLSRLIEMPNAGLATDRSCGDRPLLGTSLTANWQTVGADTVVTLSWGPATDETGGEKDVVRYVIWRKTASDPAWGDPYLSIPAGLASYSYVDGVVQHNVTYDYALAAQDCSGTQSSQTFAAPVAVP